MDRPGEMVVHHIQCGCGFALKSFDETCPGCNFDHAAFYQQMRMQSRSYIIKQFADSLNSATPHERENALADFRLQAKFCFECGSDTIKGIRCHCTNDE